MFFSITCSWIKLPDIRCGPEAERSIFSAETESDVRHSWSVVDRVPWVCVYRATTEKCIDTSTSA